MSFIKLQFWSIAILVIAFGIIRIQADVADSPEEVLKARAKRATDEKTTRGSLKGLSMDGFVNVNDCLFMFNAGGKAKVYEYEEDNTGKSGPEIKYVGSYAFDLPAKPSSSSGSECAKNSNQTNAVAEIGTATLKLKYDLTSNNASISSVVIEMKIDVNDFGRNWSLIAGSKASGKLTGSNILITRKGKADQQIMLKQSGVVSASTFSFSCLQMEFVSPSPTNSSLQTIKLTLNRFQLQPYTAENPKKVFYASFDCSTWTTIATWAGLFTVLLFTAIVAIGVYFLFDIKTPDRFENPKGKTITVAVGE